MKTKNTRLRGFTLVELLVVIVIIAALAGLSAPMILRQQKAAARTEAINNAKQIGLAFVEFDVEFGSYPDRETATMVADATGTSLSLAGNSANDYFRQLIAFNTQSEAIFFAKTQYTRKPDNVMTQGKALQAGEVGFGYILLNQNTGQSSSGNPNRPVLATPLLNAGTDWRFDPDPFGGKAVILRIDNSVEAPIIRDRDNFVTVGAGRTIQQTGEESVWGTGTNPTLVAPQPRGGN